MKHVVAASTLACVMSSGGSAAALEHYLYARSATSFDAASVSAPDLSPFVEHTYEVGVAGVNDASAHNHAEVNSGSGHLLVTVQAAQKLGTATIDPKGWNPAARLEETFHKPAGSTVTSVHVAFTSSAGAALANTTPLGLKANTTLNVNGCQIYLSRQFVSTGAQIADEYIDNCSPNANTLTVARQGDALVIDMKVTGSTVNVQAQLDITASHGGFVGSIDANLQGDLVVQAVGGTLSAASPTFGTTAALPDGGATDAATADGAVGPGPGPTGSDGGTDPGTGGQGSGGTSGVDAGTAPPSGSSDGGCAVRPDAAITAMTGGPLAALALALAAALRRHRRGR